MDDFENKNTENISDLIHKTALDALNSCPLTAYRDKITLDEVKALTKMDTGVASRISIIGMDILEIDGELAVVVACGELPNNYFYGGAAFKTLFDAIIQVAGGDIGTLNDSLMDYPLSTVLKSIKTRSGNDFTQVTIV